MREFLASIDSRELSLWMAFERVEPFGERQADMRAAITAAAAVAPWSKETPDPADFFPSLREETGPQSIEEQIRLAELMTLAMGGEVKR